MERNSGLCSAGNDSTSITVEAAADDLGAVTADKLTILHSFTAVGTDGADPVAALVLSSNDGYFYGTTEVGGTGQVGAFNAGAGTVFRMDSTGKLATLYSFTGGTDGEFPMAALVEDSDGYFYGTTASYGDSGDDGAIFRISSAGKLTTLHQFTGTGAEGYSPAAALVGGGNGNLYGTTPTGGGGGGGDAHAGSTGYPHRGARATKP